MSSHTDHGEVVARLLPAHKLARPGSPALLSIEQLAAEMGIQLLEREEWLTPPEGDVWTNLERLSREISAQWPEGVSAIDAVRDVRREL